MLLASTGWADTAADAPPAPVIAPPGTLLTLETALEHVVCCILVALLAAAALVWSRALKRRVARRTRDLALQLDQRRQAEQALRLSEERFSKVFQASPVGVSVTAVEDGRILEANPAMLRILGLPGERIIGRTMVDLGVWASAADRQAVMSQLLQKKSLPDLEAKYPHPCGQTRDILATMELTEVEGRPCVLTFAQDVTERKRVEEALRSERDFADRLVETAQAIVLVLDPRGRVLRFNRFAQDLTGYSRQEAPGKDWFDTFLPADIRQEVREAFRKVVALPVGQTFQYVNPILTRDGRQPIIRWLSSLLHGAQGELLGVLSLGYDITEIRHKEEQLREAAKMEAVGRLAGGIAHDFNNMLAIIQGYADLLLRRPDVEPDTAGDLEKVRDAARRGALLTRQLLTFARRQVVEPRLLRPNDVITGLSSMLKRVISEDITLQTDLAGDLWPVRADLSQMEQVLLNLTVNAREAMPQGGRLTVATANRTFPASDVPPGLPPGDYVVLSVTDTGVGMDEESQAHIFEPFYTTKGGRNTGLGLATCLGIVQQCAGHIAVESRPGAGTTFRIYLPRTEVTEKDLAPAAGITPEPAEPPTGTETVLVVEDQPDVRKVTCAILRRQGYHVLEAANASDAADIARKNSDRPIHLLVTDVVMPDKSGGALAAEVRRIHPTIRVLYVSGYAEKAAAGEPHEPGAQFLAKPFSYRQLAAAVRRALDAGRVDPARRR